MDIDLLSKMVKELILDEDRVVLPGLGCFVAEIVPASFSDKGYTINPPYRRLYFRSRPDEGDGLVDFYARTNSIEYDMAERILTDFLNELKTVLHTRKTVVFPGLGRLRATKENNLFFVADEDLDIYPEGFGLEPVSLKTHKESAEEVSAAVVGLKSMLLSPDPAPVPDPVPDPVPEPEPVAEPVAEPVVEPVAEPVPIPEPLPEPEPVVEPEPVIEPEPVVLPEPEPVPEPVPLHHHHASVHGHSESRKHEGKDGKAGRIVLKVFIVLIVVAVVILAAYMAIGRLCPEWIDGFLYTPEELEILNHR